MEDRKDTNNEDIIDATGSDKEPVAPGTADTSNGDGSVPSTTTEPEPVVMSSETTDMAPKKSKTMLLGTVVVVILVIAGIVWFAMGRDDTQSAATNDPSLTRSYPEVVAVVNGQEIKREDMVESVANVGLQAQNQGMDVSTKETQDMIEQEAINGLVNTAILTQVATEAGVTVDEGEVEAEIANIKTQLGGEEAFVARIEQLNMTMEDVEADVREQLMIDQYLAANTDNTDTTVSDEEVEAFYNQLVAGAAGAEVPSLEEVTPQIEAQLQSQSQQTALSNLIEELRNEAEIEIRI